MSPLTPEQRDLAARHYPIAEAMSRRRSRWHPSAAEEYHDAAIDGLILGVTVAVESEDRRTPAVVACIDNKFRTRARRLRRPSPLPLRRPDIEVEARLPDGTPDFDAILSALDSPQRLVVEATFRDDLPRRAACKKLGMSEGSVAHHGRRALDRVRTLAIGWGA